MDDSFRQWKSEQMKPDPKRIHTTWFHIRKNSKEKTLSY